jgi:hypothetical protein
MFQRLLYAAGCAIAILYQSGCATQPDVRLTDTLGSSIDQTGGLYRPDIRMYAPVVVVAYVNENRVAKANIPAARYPKLALNLHVVRCRLENLLRGSLDGEEFSFYYFGDDKNENPLYRKTFSAEAGGRYVFFLSRENGLLRSIADVGDYSVEVLSGAHRMYISHADLGALIVGILLSPGEGVKPEEFTRSISTAAARVEHLGSSRLLEVRLLRNLLSQPNPVRFAACRQLSQAYNSQYGCLSDLIRNEKEPSANREWALARLGQVEKVDEELIAALESPTPIDDFAAWIGNANSRNAVSEELQILLSSPNSRLRATACAVWKRYYPKDARAGC